MSDLLSQEELGALLDLVGSGRGAGKSAVRAREAQPYDFQRRSKLTPREHSRLERLIERGARATVGPLRRLLRVATAVSPPLGAQVGVRRFLDGLPPSSVLFALSLAPEEGLGALVLEADFLARAVDRMLGGEGTSSPGGDPTRAALSLGRRLAEAFLQPFREVLRELAPLTLSVERVEVDAPLSRSLPASEPLVTYEFEVVAGPVKGTVRLALPARLLAGALQRPQRTQEGNPVRKLDAGGFVGQLPLEVSAVVGETPIPLRTLLNLEVGDVLTLGQSTHDPVEVRVSGVVKFQGLPGRRRGKRVVKLSATPPPPAPTARRPSAALPRPDPTSAPPAASSAPTPARSDAHA
ncbi:MAG: hypothetical protein D6731_20345 [Planctomycetota bacterium]|nr:MAG: hypothetical protein D6731_20345 [Planctomycetota bacterium]